MTQAVTTLGKVTCFVIDAHLWGARKKLRPEDLKNVASDDLPPADLASLGSKKVIDTKEIAVFDTLKKRAERFLEGIGVRFLGGYAIPDDKTDDAAKKLDEIAADFETEKTAFLDTYDAKVEEWIKQHPGWESVIRNAALTSQDVGSRLAFAWQAYKITEAAPEENKAINAGLKSAIGGLAGTLYTETADAARKMRDSAVSLGKWTNRTLRPLKAIREKLVGLSFLDSGVTPLVASIDHVLGNMPGQGPFEANEISSALLLLSVLCDEERMQEHARIVAQGADLDALFAPAAPVVKPEVVEAASAVEEKQDDVAAQPPAPQATVAVEAELFF